MPFEHGFPRLLILSAAAPRPPANAESATEPATPESPPPPPAEPPVASLDQRATAEAFAKADQPMTLLDPERPWVSHHVGRDLAHPETWRHTTLVDSRPFEDAEFDAAEDAFLSALAAGGLPRSDQG